MTSRFELAAMYVYLFNVFLNDSNIFHNDVPALFKYADDSTVIAPVSRFSRTNFKLVKRE